MRATCVSLAILAIFSSVALGQNYRLEFHSDEALSSCELAVTSPGLIKVHMVVTGQGGPLAGLSFKAVRPPCMRSAVWLADIWQQPPVRAYVYNTQHPDAVDVALDCAPPPPDFPRYLPVYLGWIWYSVTGPIDPCCAYEPVAPPDRSSAVLIMCSDFGNEMPMSSGKLVMNPNDTCRCDLPLPVRQSTWGSVKALYR